MQIKIQKMLSFIVILLLVLVNAMPVISYASEQVVDSKTSEENVEFTAKIDGLTDSKADLSSTLNLNLSVKVLNTGYIKDASITLADNNYVVSGVDNEHVKEIKNSTIVLNQINAGKEAKINLPVKLPKTEKVAAFVFDNTSKITLKAIYVNEKGKEKSITKVVNQKLIWTKDDAKNKVSQKLVRYLKYDQTKTMLTFEVTDGIVDNAIPMSSKEISIVVPQLNKNLPSKVIFTEEGYESNYKDGIFTVTKKNEKDSNGQINWNSDSKIIVTYLYDVQTSEKNIQSDITSKITTVLGNVLEAKSDTNTYSIESQVGSIVELSTESEKELSKGYMYTNLDKSDDKLETSYNEKYTIDLGSSELTDKVQVEEKESGFLNENGKLVIEATNMIETKSVSISQDNLSKVLGNDGYIKIFDTSSKELGTLSKDNLKIDLKDQTKILLETSKPQAEGKLELTFAKAIKGDLGLSKDQIAQIKMLASNVNVKGIKADTEISTKLAQNVIKLNEPKTTVTLKTSKDALSTVVENKDVVFNIVLNSKKAENRLFENPTLELTLPEEITSINVTDAKVLYDDELTAGTINIDGRKITLTLNGKQTKYSESALTDGTLVRITANLKLNELAASNKEKITLNYKNASDNSEGTVQEDVEIVAPTGFVTANTVSDEKNSTTAIESEAKNIEVQDHTSSKEINVTGTIVNNLGEDASGVTVVGVFPYEGNKSQEGVDLGTNVTTNLTGKLNVDGLENAKVYYSEDENATVDSNTWNENATTSAKAYKITTDSKLANKAKASFSYKVALPQNMDYAKTANQTYGVYYNNNSEEGTKQNLVQAQKAGASTPNVPVVNMTVSAADTNEGYAISNGANVTEGEEVTYRVKITNTGSESAKNVKVTMNLPEGMYFIDHKYTDKILIKRDYYAISEDRSRVTQVSEVGQNSTSVVEFKAIVLNSTPDKELTTTYSLTADNLSKASNATFTNKATKGTLKARLTANKADSTVTKDDEITFSLELTNLTSDKQNNVTATIELPDGMEYVDKEEVIKAIKSSLGENADVSSLSYKSNYDNKKRTLTINVGSIEADRDYTADIKTKITGDKTSNLKVQAKVKSDENQTEVKSNTMIFNAVAGTTGIEVTHTSSIGSNSAVDKDTFNIYLDIKNNGGKKESLLLTDNIPERLQVNSYKLTVDGTEIESGESNYIDVVFDLDTGKSARLSIVVKPNTIGENETETFEITPALTTTDGDEIKVNTLSIKVKGTGEVSDESNRKYAIAGVVFEDVNNNGKIDEDEKRFSNITVMLFDPSTSKVATNSNGEEYKTTTGTEGDYRFNDLPRGNYIVVAKFDNKQYGVGLYKASGVDEAENIDFVSASLNNEEVAASNTIKLQQNEYNINLGLVSKNTFDLSLNKCITKITVANSKNGTKVYNYDNTKTAKVELSTKNIESDTLLIEYKISVTNEGKVEGYADSIVDYIPEGLTFNADLNSTWYMKDGNAYNQSLANTLIKPGETKDLILVLSKKMTGEDTGTYNNIAEIASSYNEYSIKDIDSTAGNKKDGEDDLSTAVAVVLMSTGKEAISVAGITLGILALVGFAVFEIKKHIISNKI